MNTHILVVDDEKELADVLELYLVSDGYTVHKCYTGAEAMDCGGDDHALPLTEIPEDRELKGSQLHFLPEQEASGHGL